MNFQLDPKGNLNITLPNTARTKAQRHVVSTMVKNNDITKLIKYLESFKAKRNQWVDVDRIKAPGFDTLEQKRPNTMAKLFEKLTRLDINHAPHSTKTTWCGVEIECCIPYEGVSLESGERECSSCEGSGRDSMSCDDYGCEDDTCEGGHMGECSFCEGSGNVESDGDSYQARKNLEQLFRNERVTLTSIKTDGSIQAPSGYFGMEITVLTKSDDSRNLEKVCKLLNRIGAKVNRSCGLHVHLDARHLDGHGVKRMGKRLGHALPLIAQMLPKSRLNNSYCKMAVSKLTGGRYFAVNLTAFSKFQTIEVRCHSSTTDYQKITNWIEIVRAIAYADGLRRDVKTINELTEFVGIREDVLEYMAQRMSHFNPAPKQPNEGIVDFIRRTGPLMEQAPFNAYADNDDITEPQQEVINF